MSDAAKAAEEAAANEAGNGEGATPERTYTQAELESIIQGRLAKFSDYNTIKSELETIRKESMTEQERAVNEARDAARAEVLAEVNGRLVTSEARVIAAELGFLYPQDAHFYIDASQITVNDDGTVDTKAVKAALESAVKERPALVKQKDTEVPDPSNAGIGVSAPAKPRTVEDAWAAAVGGKTNN